MRFPMLSIHLSLYLKVYDNVMKLHKLTFLERLHRYRTVGKYAGILICYISMLVHFWVKIVEWWQPRMNIDVVPDLIGADDRKRSVIKPQISTQE